MVGRKKNDKPIKQMGGFAYGQMGGPKLKAANTSDEVKKKIMAFTTKINFNNMMKTRKWSPTQIAGMLGIRVTPGKRLTAKDISDLSTQGYISEKKRRGF